MAPALPQRRRRGAGDSFACSTHLVYRPAPGLPQRRRRGAGDSFACSIRLAH